MGEFSKILHGTRVIGLVLEIGNTLVPQVIKVMESAEVDANEAATLVLTALGDRTIGKFRPRTVRLFTLGIASMVEDLRRADGLPTKPEAPTLPLQGG